MIKNMYKELIETIKQKKELREKIEYEKMKFEDSIKLDLAMYDDLEDKEEKLREDVMLKLAEEKLDSIDVDGHTITSQIKKTKKIVDTIDLINDILINVDKIKPYTKGASKMSDNKFREWVNAFFVTEHRITDKKIINDIINKFEDIEGKLLKGVKIQNTHFLTVK
jgi:hypothetical protein